MVRCNKTENGYCVNSKIVVKCTGAGIDLNGCPEWAIVHALQDLTETVRALVTEGIGA